MAYFVKYDIVEKGVKKEISDICFKDAFLMKIKDFDSLSIYIYDEEFRDRFSVDHGLIFNKKELDQYLNMIRNTFKVSLKVEKGFKSKFIDTNHYPSKIINLEDIEFTKITFKPKLLTKRYKNFDSIILKSIATLMRYLFEKEYQMILQKAFLMKKESPSTSLMDCLITCHALCEETYRTGHSFLSINTSSTRWPKINHKNIIQTTLNQHSFILTMQIFTSKFIADTEQIGPKLKLKLTKNYNNIYL